MSFFFPRSLRLPTGSSSLKLHRFICNPRSVLPVHWLGQDSSVNEWGGGALLQSQASNSLTPELVVAVEWSVDRSSRNYVASGVEFRGPGRNKYWICAGTVPCGSSSAPNEDVEFSESSGSWGCRVVSPCGLLGSMEMTKLSTAPGGTNLNLNISFGMSALCMHPKWDGLRSLNSAKISLFSIEAGS